MSFFSLLLTLVLAVMFLPLILNLLKLTGTTLNNANSSLVEDAVNSVVDKDPVIPYAEAKKQNAGKVASNNLKSNLTFTPLPDDPLFGDKGFFTQIGEGISNFFNPQEQKPLTKDEPNKGEPKKLQLSEDVKIQVTSKPQTKGRQRFGQ